MDTIYLIGFPDLGVPHHVATSHLLKRQSHVYDTENPRVPVPKGEWQNAHRKAVSAVQKLLVEGLLERDYYNNPSHTGGEARCYHYWFTETGLRRLRLLEVTRGELHGHTFNALERTFSASPSSSSGITDQLSNHVQNCRIDPARLADVTSDPDFQVSGDVFHAVSLLNNGPFCLRSSTERRVHTSFSGLPSRLKSLVSLDGHSDLVEVDITGSNPFLLAHRLSALRVASRPGSGLRPTSSILDGPNPSHSTHYYYNAITEGLKVSLSRVSEYYGYSQYSGLSYSTIPYTPHNMCNAKTEFERLCLNGRIYEEVADALGGTYKQKKPTREDGKRAVMLLMNQPTADWKRWKSSRKKYRALKERWPGAIRRIGELKARHKRGLGVSLMREEAEMVIDRVAGDLLNYDLPFLTAHDGIYVPRKYGPAVKAKMETHYERAYSTAPQITIE